MKASLQVDPPGFRDTTLHIGESLICTIAELSNPDVVDLDWLTGYSHVALIGIDESVLPDIASICAAFEPKHRLRGRAIQKLLDSTGAIVLRVLDRETHLVFQLIAAPDVCDVAARCLTELHVRRIYNERTFFHEIKNLRPSWSL